MPKRPESQVALRSAQVQVWREFCRSWTAEHAVEIAQDILDNGTQNERASLLVFMSAQAHGGPPKAEAAEERDGVVEILTRIAAEHTAELEAAQAAEAETRAVPDLSPPKAEGEVMSAVPVDDGPLALLARSRQKA